MDITTKTVPTMERWFGFDNTEFRMQWLIPTDEGFAFFFAAYPVGSSQAFYHRELLPKILVETFTEQRLTDFIHLKAEEFERNYYATIAGEYVTQ